MMQKLASARRILREEGRQAVVRSSWVALGKWWRQGEVWQVQKSSYVRISGIRIGIDSPAAQSVKNLLTTGMFEEHERKAIRKYLDHGLPVVEFGACIGVVACSTNRLLRDPSRHVVVEANPELIETLRANRERNRCGFTILNRAVGYSQESSLSFHIQDHNLLGSGTRGGGRMVSVPPVSLREILDQFRFGQCSLICDIEGAEVDLVAHELDVLSRRVPLIILEVHEKMLGAGPIAEMLHRLQSAGFKVLHRSWETYVLRNERLS